MEFRVLKYFSFAIILFLFTACTKEVYVDIPGFVEKVVIEGTIETDGMPFVLISKSKDVYSETSQEDLIASFLPGAKVWVSDGTNTIQLTEICTNDLPAGADTAIANSLGVPIEVISKVGICAYVGLDPSFKGEVGKTYTLKVEFEGQTYEASSEILEPKQLVEAYWKEETKEGFEGFGTVYFKVDDPADETNAYVTEVMRMNLGPDGKPIDKRYNKPSGSYFDDEFFNGKLFELSLENPVKDTTIDKKFRGYFKEGDTLSIKFSTYPHEVYRFLYSVAFQQLVGGSPFSTPSNPKGNIPGALGAWIAYSPSYTTIVCEK